MTASLEALRNIMLDENISLRRRVEAAESILSFESPSEMVEEAKAFLTEVFDDRETNVDLRLDALKIMRKAEARKVTQPPTVSIGGGGFPNNPEMRARSRRMAQRKAAYERRKKLEAAGLWPAPPGWDADIFSDDWVEPPIDYGLPPNAGLADRIGAARKEYLKGIIEGWAREPETEKGQA
jgi:hypothetical protein